jgi:hypothetical protein
MRICINLNQAKLAENLVVKLLKEKKKKKKHIS